MAEFDVKVYKIREIADHPAADRLELAHVAGYVSIVGKGQFKKGDLAAYIPEGAVVPRGILKQLGLVDKLAGKEKNRVKAVRLRSIFSQGILFPAREGWKEGDDVTEELGITKYEPPIPASMSGQVFNAFGMTLKYDIENIKKYPDTFIEGEEVIMTEKIHGTWCCFGYHPNCGMIVTSKGLSAGGKAFKLNDKNKNNVYVRMLESTIIADKNVIERGMDMYGTNQAFYILGEIFGPGIQDLTYGQDKPAFRVFDIYLGQPEQGRYLNLVELQTRCNALKLEMVPMIYKGPYSKNAVRDATIDRETVSGTRANVKEGVVIKPVQERYDEELGRVILKSVHQAYLLRKGGTEYN